MSTALSDAAELVLGALTPLRDVRWRPGPDTGDVTARLGGDLLVHDR